MTGTQLCALFNGFGTIVTLPEHCGEYWQARMVRSSSRKMARNAKKTGFSLALVALLAACADETPAPVAKQPSPSQPANTAPAAPFADLQDLAARGTPDQKRQALASLTVAKCFLANNEDNSFRGVSEDTVGMENRGRTSDGVDVFVDKQVGMMIGLSDTMCHVMIAGADVDGVASMVEPTLSLGSPGQPKYQQTPDGYGARFLNPKGDKFLSIVRADTIPGSDNSPSVSIFVVKE
ncbi:MAG: hypothetical protein AAGK00_05360 [Pseudomonadota bacterium]